MEIAFDILTWMMLGASFLILIVVVLSIPKS